LSIVPSRQSNFFSWVHAIVIIVVIVVAVVAGLASATSWAAAPPPMHAAHAAVASDNPQASDIGVQILKAGGNAADAACAIALALGVTHPYASGIGGGGFALVYLAAEHRVHALDFRERAPSAIRPEDFVKDGHVDGKLSREGGLAVAVPGEVRGLAELVHRFGRLPFASCVAPAEKLARTGFLVSWRLAEVLQGERDEPIRRMFAPAGVPLPITGARLRSADLARTLNRLRLAGPEAFYRGEIADEIVHAVHAAGGVLTGEDLASYRPTERVPLETTYRGLRVYVMPPPSSGGVAVIEALGILTARFPDSQDLMKLGPGSSAYFQVLAETMKHAFADRARFLGDSDFVTVPTARLVSPAYTASLAGKIQDRTVLARDAYGSPEAPPDLHRDGGTSHLSVIDAAGNAVALTTTVNLGFGAKLVAGKTGIILNDQMDDFAMQPGIANGFGLIGSAQNAVAPGKRPLSSMSPTIVLDGETVRLVAGAAGGPTIITATLQVLLNVIDWKMDVQNAVSAVRIHDQWVPELVMVEPEVSRDVVDALVARGQKVKAVPHVGVANAVTKGPGGLDAAAEPRSPSRPAGY
jgi:gamma-glutamyltranspeptidase/glutathione hydrolase